MLLALSAEEEHLLFVMGKNPDGDRLKQLLKRQLAIADEKNRGAFGVPLHQSQGHAQVLQALIERLEGKKTPVMVPRRREVEENLFGV